MKYAGVDVDHPRVVEGIRALLKQGTPRAEIVKVIGMPHEVVERVERDLKRTSTT